MRIEKKLKSTKGFTLVELVVVIAVLAILAGVGTVAYRGYISKAEEAADVSQLAAILTAADGAAAADEDHISVTKIVVTTDTTTDKGKVTKVDITGTKAGGTETKALSFEASSWDGTDFALFLSGNTLKLTSKTYEGGANWTTANGWKAGTT